MTGCKRCAVKGRKREKEREENTKKEGKMGIKIIYKSLRMFFFHMRSGHFSNKEGKVYLDLEDHVRYCLRSKF